jgi:heat shock protein HslJ
MKAASVLIAAIVLAGCASVADASLEGREFLSTSVTEDGQERPLVDETRIRLRFEDGQIGASAGCNTMGGSYRLEDRRLIFEGGAMTEMGCDQARHEQDDWLFGFLGSQPAVALDGPMLTLTADSTIITLQDREVADPDRDLVGTTWEVDTVFSDGAASSTPAEAAARLSFNPDGTLDLESGCNSGSGRYEIEGARIRISDLVMTDMACVGGGGALEAVVLDVLRGGELRWEIEAATLRIGSAEMGLGLTARQ